MLTFLVIAFLAGFAGDPAVGESAPPVEVSAPEAAEAPAAAPAPAANEAAAENAAPAAPQYRTERRCENIEITGRRMPQRVCRNVQVLVEADEAE